MTDDDAVIAAAEAILNTSAEHFTQEVRRMEPDPDARHRFVERWNLVAQAVDKTWGELSALLGPYGAGEFDAAMARLHEPDRQRAELLADIWGALQSVFVPLRAERELHDMPEEEGAPA